MVYAHRDDLLVVLAGYNESSAMHTPDPSPTHLTPTPQYFSKSNPLPPVRSGGPLLTLTLTLTLALNPKP